VRCAGGADRATVDAGGSNADEEEPVETGVAALQGAIADLWAGLDICLWVGHFHRAIFSPGGRLDRRFSDMVTRG
jgi:hypothetical protein